MFNLDKSPRDDKRLEQFWILALTGTAFFLYIVDLDNLPLRDWDEGIVASVARDIFRSSNWLFPTQNGEIYFNKPPLIHGLIAVVYSFAGVSEWSTRFAPAMLSALCVPLLYAVAREVFPTRTPALFSALVYLTLLPVLRHGRLAMLDGAINCFLLLTIWSVLRSRRDLRFALGIGFSLGLVALTKGILAILLCGIIMIFIVWDTPRLLRSKYLWMGLFLGVLPACGWYGMQILHYGDLFVQTHLLNQSFSRIVTKVEGNTGPVWYYLLEILKYAWPWLFFLPVGLRLAWENRTMGWAKLICVWGGVYLIVISLMQTKLPWYVLPFYPVLALVCGVSLADMWGQRIRNQRYFPLKDLHKKIYSGWWVGLFALLAVVSSAGFIYFRFGPVIQPDIQLVMACVALTMMAVAFLIFQQDPQFILVLFWGCYLSLTLFVMSDNWVWELAESYPVKPVAEIIKKSTPPGTIIYTSFGYNRPSLDFYSDRRVISATPEQLQKHAEQEDKPYLLLDENALQNVKIDGKKELGRESGLILVTKKN